MEMYILEGHKPVRCHDAKKWGLWYATHDKERRVAYTKITRKIEVSTVFLGIDHAFMGGPPQLFETMIFRKGKAGEADGQEQWRWHTWEEAETAHWALCDILKDPNKTMEDFACVVNLLYEGFGAEGTVQ